MTKEQYFPCLSMLQPWASLLVLGIKQVETRSFKIWRNHRGRLYIHASKVRKKDYIDYYVKDEAFRSYTNMAYERIHGGRPRIYSVTDSRDPYGYQMEWRAFKEAFPVGKIIGSVNVLDCVESFDLKARYDKMHRWDDWEREWTLGDLSSDRYGWPVDQPTVFKQDIPAKGQLGLWNCAEFLPKSLQP